jgi:hypothetical protein
MQSDDCFDIAPAGTYTFFNFPAFREGMTVIPQ